MSVSVFSRNKVGTADELTPVATKNNQRVYVGTKKAVEAAMKDGDIGENSVVYITDDYKEKTTEQVPVGTIMPYAGKVSPKGYLLCNGASFDKTAYPELFDVLGVNTTPNLTGRFLMGSGTEAAGTYVDESLPNHSHYEFEGSQVATVEYPPSIEKEDIPASGTNRTDAYRYAMTKPDNALGEYRGRTTKTDNAVYQDNAKVRPDSFVVTYIIKAE